MHSLLQDVHYSVRMMRKSPAASAVIVLTLGLGIGANMAMFSSFDAWVLRPLPFREPERLVALHESQPKLGRTRQSIAPATLRDWNAQQKSFEEIGLYSRRLFNFQGEEEPERLHGTLVSASLFPMLGVDPVLGRTFAPEEEVPGGPAVALISDSLWKRRFGADPRVLGSTFRLDGRPHQVVGVMEPGFGFPEWADVWTPLALDPADSDRADRWLSAIARLRPGSTVESAGTDLAGLAARLEALYPESASGWSAAAIPLREEFVPPVIQVALGASLATGILVLLIICANVVNLMLAQATARGRETALRTALGAARGRLVRQTLTETTVIALLGGGLGALGGVWALDWMLTWVPLEVPYLFTFHFDARIALYTLAVSLVTGVVCGLGPVARSSGLDLNAALRAGAGAGESRRGSFLRRSLVVGEVGFSVLLVVGALLMVTSFLRSQQAEPGFRAEGALTLRLALGGEGYEEPAQRAAFLSRLTEAVEGFDGVSSAGAVNLLPATRLGYGTTHVEAQGRSAVRGEEPVTTLYAVAGNYLEALEVPLLEGRLFEGAETRDGAAVAVVSRSLAEELWPGEDPLRRQLRRLRGEPGPWLTVVGVVGDIEAGHNLVSFGERPASQIYLPYGQAPTEAVTVLARGAVPPAALAEAVRAAVRRLDPGLPIADVLTLEQAVAEVQWVSRYFSRQFSLYALLALTIAALGVYGVTADSVSRRTREIGIRIALGSATGQLLQLIVGQGLIMSLLGVGLGLAAAVPVTHLGRSVLHEVSAFDPLIYGGVALLMVAVAALASYLPARRAAAVDPIRALRAD